MGFALTPMVRTLLLLNVGIFILQQMAPAITLYGSLYSFLSPYFQPWQLVSYMFLHGGVGHIFSNMFGLFMFGPLLERMWGPQRFLFFYLFTGIGAGLLQSGVNYYEMSQMRDAVETYMQQPSPDHFVRFLQKHASEYYRPSLDFVDQYEDNPTNPTYINETQKFVSDYYWGRLGNSSGLRIGTVGASGAIFGILMAFGLLFPNTELFLLLFPFPIKAKYFVALYGLFELIGGFQQRPDDNVAHFAHIGGMFFAYILIKVWGNQRDKFY